MTSIRVYEYGLLPPHTNAARVHEQMVRAHRYRNMLVEIERERRQKVREAMGAHPDLAPLEEQLRTLVERRDAVREGIRAQRRRTRSRSESPEARQAVKDLAAQIKPLRDQVKAVRKAVAEDSTVREAMAGAEASAKARLKKARHDCGVYWGTYLLQEAAADQARKERTPPKFVRWRGEGRVSVQIQKGIDLDDLFGSDTQVHVDRPDQGAWDPGRRRGERRRFSRTILRLRVGSEGPGNRKPIWAEWRMVMHRPIPDGAIIKIATVSRRRRDCVSDEWRVQFTVDVSACSTQRAAPAAGVVALNLGFCQRQDGIRSGFLVGDDGLEQEILVQKSDLIRESSRADLGPVDDQEQTSPAAPGPDRKSIHAERGREQHKISPAAPGPARPEHQENSTSSVEACPAVRQTSPAAPGPVPDQRNWIINGLSKADSIRSFRDKAMDKMKALLVAWHAGEAVDGAAICEAIREFTKDEPARRLDDPMTDKTSPAVPGQVRDDGPDRGDQPGGAGTAQVSTNEFPEWFVKATEALHAWRSAERFRRLVYEWKEQRFLGDTPAFALLWAWQHRDEHLERYESGLRRSALRDRREGYRILAARMARRYRFLVIDNTDLAEFQRNPAVESKEVSIPIVKRNQRTAAGSELRNCMINAFGPSRVILQDHKDMTRRCHLCGHINDWDRVAFDRFHTCGGCGARWDQDSNNCKNKLAEYRRSAERGDTGGPQPRKPSRSERFREARAHSANSAV